MLSEKQFRERAKTELRQIGDQLLGLATDRDIYWKLEREIIQNNPQLCEARSDAARHAARLLCRRHGGPRSALLDGEDARLSAAGADRSWPSTRRSCTTGSRNASSPTIAPRCSCAVMNLQRLMAPHTAHHERTLSALASLHRELDTALDLMIAERGDLLLDRHRRIHRSGCGVLPGIRCRSFSLPGRCRCWRSDKLRGCWKIHDGG